VVAAKFDIVATGGTFDEIHVGHLGLLSKAFEVGKKVIIGVSSDIPLGKMLWESDCVTGPVTTLSAFAVIAWTMASSPLGVCSVNGRPLGICGVDGGMRPTFGTPDGLT